MDWDHRMYKDTSGKALPGSSFVKNRELLQMIMHLSGKGEALYLLMIEHPEIFPAIEAMQTCPFYRKALEVHASRVHDLLNDVVKVVWPDRDGRRPYVRHSISHRDTLGPRQEECTIFDVDWYVAYSPSWVPDASITVTRWKTGLGRDPSNLNAVYFSFWPKSTGAR